MNEMPHDARGAIAAAAGSHRLVRSLFRAPSSRRLEEQLEVGIDRVEVRLREEAGHARVVDPKVVDYLVSAGGKRIRPLLVLLTAELGEGPSDAVVDGAVAVELTHVATLYHDDVMDEADVRRGVPSANRLWGNNVAVLAGDVLSARAYRLATFMPQRLLQLHVEAFERLVAGQLNETLGPPEGVDPIDHYMQVLADKTGSLIACAAEMGLGLSNGPEEFSPALREYGESIGVAFQLVDDVIDLTSTEEELGKRPGADLRAGVPTLPLLLLRQRAISDSDAAATLANVERDLRDEETAPAALRVLAAHPVTGETLSRATEWAAKAKAALSPLPAGSVRTALELFADHLVDRSH